MGTMTKWGEIPQDTYEAIRKEWVEHQDTMLDALDEFEDCSTKYSMVDAREHESPSDFVQAKFEAWRRVTVAEEKVLRLRRELSDRFDQEVRA